MSAHACDAELDLIYTSDGETLRCPDCQREWIAVQKPLVDPEVAREALDRLQAGDNSPEVLQIVRDSVEAYASMEIEYAWEADEEKRAQMSPRGPKVLTDGHFGTPEEIAAFPRGRRVRRIKAGPWIPVEEIGDPPAPA